MNHRLCVLAPLLALAVACSSARHPVDARSPAARDAFTIASPVVPPEWFAPPAPLPAPPATRVAYADAAVDPELPASLRSASASLFAHGLADPRGCAYRAVDLVAGDVHGGPGARVATHAWVLPAADPQGRRFAVAWNGLVYPVLDVGAVADLAADVQHATTTLTALRDAGATQITRVAYEPATVYERDAIGLEHASLLRVALLTRLGERALARRLWHALVAPDAQVTAAGLFDALAGEWTWSLEDRALCAHLRGDRFLALASLRTLDGAYDALDAERARLAPDASPPAASIAVVPRADLEALERDEVRRIDAPRAVGSSPVAQAVDALDDVAVPQDGQPGGVPLEYAPAVVRLVALGDAAVEPLLAALEHDDRLTRSISYWRDFTHDRHVMPAWRAAQTALEAILQTSLEPTTPGAWATGLARREVSAQARAYWSRFHGAPRDARFFAVLADDGESAAHQVEAARWLSTPSASRDGASAYVTSEGSTRQGSLAHLALDGDGLRARRAPSVTDLLVRRMDALWPADNASRDVALYTRREQSCALASALAQWDARGALPALARQSARALAKLVSDGEAGDEYDGSMVGCFVSTALVRALAGDPGGLDDYAAWITTVDPARMPAQTDFYLEPLWYAPTRPSIARALDALFVRPNPRWVPLAGGRADRTSWLASPLRNVAAFRDHVLRPGLADRTAIGDYTITAARSYALTLPGSGGETGGLPDGVTDVAPVGSSFTVRRCDYYAFRMLGPAAFRLDRSDAVKDAALAHAEPSR